MQIKKLTLIATVAASAALAGCIPALVVGGASTGGVVAAQERSAGNAVDDTDIRVAIHALYVQKDFKDLYNNVNVKVTEGRVMLTGNVDKPETSMNAVQLAWKVKGVKEVMNELQVNDKTGITDYLRDSWIANEIRSKMLIEKNVRSVNYNVEVVNNVVYLIGIAQNQQELDKVTYLASTTPYVKEVVSHVIMKDDPRRAGAK